MKKRISILIVDDDADLADSLTDILAVKGFDASFATSGKEALKIIKGKKIDAIFLDIRMPEMNGVETLNYIKKYSPLTSVVMITAFADNELIDQAKIDGALTILKKPLDLDKIINFIEKMQNLKTLLIVDDNKEFCNTLAEYVDSYSYNVSIAHNVREGVEKYEENKSGVLLIDMKLNGDNGLEIVNTIREKDSKSAIILMSGYAGQFESLIDNAVNTKVDHFIDKPFKMNNIIELIGEVTRKKLVEVLA